MEAMYEERAAAIEGGMQQAEEAQAEARAALEKYNAQLAGARTEANEIRESAREQGASIVAEMRGQAQAEAARITESAKRQVDAERQQAVGESLKDEVRQNGIVDRFLAELEAGDVTPEKVTPAGQDA
jgi:F-type H+-transporting ATPase subunit b